jgi:methanogenic corrinoid protein MtbC1
MMVAEFFLRAGWNVWTEPRSTGEALAGIVHDNWFAVVGLSVGCETALETLPEVIRDLRRASRNRTIGVMVGGPAFNARPELVRIVGADATASDGRQAALQAETFFALAANQA